MSGLAYPIPDLHDRRPFASVSITSPDFHNAEPGTGQAPQPTTPELLLPKLVNMGVLSSKKGAAKAVGDDLAAVLPQDGRSWYTTPHLIRLNLCLLIPLLSSATVGYDGSMMNGLQILPQWKGYFGNPEGALLGVMNAVYPLGKLVALAFVAYFTDRFGRRIPLAVGLVLCIGFAIMQGLAQSIPTFITARALLGFATSCIGQPSPVLITELAYPTHRGKITAMYNTFFYFGAVFAAWCTFGTFKLPDTWAWRIPSILQGAIPVIQLAGLAFVPESPRWLVARGHTEKARKVLADFHAGGDLNAPLVNFELREIEAALELEAEMSKTSWMELVRNPANRKRTLIAVIVGWFAQWNGAAVLSYYLVLVLNTIGITNAFDQTLINGLLQIFNWIVATLGGAMMVDRIGRRTLFLVATSGMLVSYMIWTGLSAHFVQSNDAAAGKAVVAFIFIFYFFYDVAWTPMLHAYPVEIFQYTLRGRGLSVTLMASTTGLIVGNQVNPIAMKAIAWKYYIVFCCILACLVVIIYFLFPETRGHTLEEIREIFEGKLDAAGLGKDVEAAPLPSDDASDEGVVHEKGGAAAASKGGAKHMEVTAA
ncbi:lactose permease [Microdochium trichocladiopsis]|uniref:Lactose permease n=1 Tax=Microdochium trichocladiopsis TaxID=1682393 RepID=A0A9P9BP72_9PEZI|nr:lactose permease [Microdochium trichocladiopsis]KAH7028974.1 lactose permease [Microdochium trichocladiopsis]